MATKGIYKPFIYPSDARDKLDRKKHNLRCTIHESDEQEIILVCANPLCRLNRFLCAMCVPQHQLCGANLVVISNINKQDVSILDPRISKQAKQVLKNYAQDKKIYEDIDNFFDQLKLAFLKQLESSRREAKVHVERLMKERAGELRELIDIICSSFNFNAHRHLLRDLEQGRLSQQDASKRLTLYIESKQRSQKLKEVSNLLQKGAIPVRNLNLENFSSQLKKIGDILQSIKFNLLSFPDEPPAKISRLNSKKQKFQSIQLIDPYLHQLHQILKQKKTAYIKGKKFGLSNCATISEIEHPRDGYFLQKVKKLFYYSFMAMAEMLGQAIVTSQLEAVVIEVQDKWLGYREMSYLAELLSQRKNMTMQIKVRSQRIRESKKRQLLSRAGAIKLIFL